MGRCRGINQSDLITAPLSPGRWDSPLCSHALTLTSTWTLDNMQQWLDWSCSGPVSLWCFCRGFWRASRHPALEKPLFRRRRMIAALSGPGCRHRSSRYYRWSRFVRGVFALFAGKIGTLWYFLVFRAGWASPANHSRVGIPLNSALTSPTRIETRAGFLFGPALSVPGYQAKKQRGFITALQLCTQPKTNHHS